MAWNSETASDNLGEDRSSGDAVRASPPAEPRPTEPHAPSGKSDGIEPSAWREARREIVTTGVKLVFVAPLISSFLARDAHAAGSNHSCYPAGMECGGGTAEPCCPGSLCVPDVGSSTGSRCQ